MIGVVQVSQQFYSLAIFIHHTDQFHMKCYCQYRSIIYGFGFEE